MNYDFILKELSEQEHNIITTAAAEAAGISRAMLSKLCKGGKIQRIAKGQKHNFIKFKLFLTKSHEDERKSKIIQDLSRNTSRYANFWLTLHEITSNQTNKT